MQADTIDGQEVSGLLTSLGESTTAAAEGADDDQLANLGALLTQTGSSLMGDGMSGGMMTGGMMSGGGM